MSALYPRKDSKFVWIGYTLPTGERKSKSTGISLKNGKIPPEALDFQRKLDARLSLNLQTGPPTDKNLTISALFDRFMAEYGSGKANGTQYLYGLAVKRLIESVQNVRVSALSPGDMMDWRNEMVKRDGPQNASCRMRSMSTILTWAESEQLIDRNPITKAVTIKVPQGRIYTFTEAEMDKIVKSVKKPFADQMTFLRLTGFRSDEACQLKWENIDFKEGVIHVWNKKENRWDAPYPMDKKLRQFLRGLAKKDDWVLPYRDKVTVTHKFRFLIDDKLKFDRHFKIHTFRATYISRLVKSGASESELLYLARLRSIATAHRYYTAFDTGQMRSALARSR